MLRSAARNWRRVLTKSREVDFEAAKAAFEREFPCDCGPEYRDRDLHSPRCMIDEWEVILPIIDAALGGSDVLIMDK